MLVETYQLVLISHVTQVVFKSPNNASVLFNSVAQSCPTLCDPMNCSTPGLLTISNSRSSLRFRSIESVMPYRDLILFRPLLLLPPVPPSIQVFFNESTLCMRWPKYWSFSFSIIPSREIPGLISCNPNDPQHLLNKYNMPSCVLGVTWIFLM